MVEDNVNKDRPKRNSSISEFSAMALSALALGAGVAGANNEVASAGIVDKNIPVAAKEIAKINGAEKATERSLGSGVHFNCLSLSHENRAIVFEDLKSVNIGWVRINLNWNDIEPTASGVYDEKVLANLDDCIAQATANSIRPLVVFQGSPRWANGGKEWNSPPTDAADYARIAEFLAERYNGHDKNRGEVKAWEIWNETNYSNFWAGSTEQIAELTRQAYAAIKSANPKAYVVLPGVAQNDSKYLDGLLSAGAKFDILSTHFYPNMSLGNSSQSIQRIDEELQDLMKVIKKHNVKAPVWITEFGIARNNGIDPEMQAALTKRIIGLIRKYPNIKNAFWWQAMPSESSDSWEESLGAIDRKTGKSWPVLNEIGKLSTKASKITPGN